MTREFIGDAAIELQGEPMIYTPKNGVPVSIRAIIDRSSGAQDAGDANVQVERLSVSISPRDVPDPNVGDRVTLASGEVWEVSTEPDRESMGICWDLNCYRVE